MATAALNKVETEATDDSGVIVVVCECAALAAPTKNMTKNKIKNTLTTFLPKL